MRNGLYAFILDYAAIGSPAPFLAMLALDVADSSPCRMADC